MSFSNNGGGGVGSDGPDSVLSFLQESNNTTIKRKGNGLKIGMVILFFSKLIDPEIANSLIYPSAAFILQAIPLTEGMLE